MNRPNARYGVSLVRRLARVTMPDALIEICAHLVGWTADVIAPDRGLSAEMRARATLFNLKFGWHTREIGRGVVLAKPGRISLARNVKLRNHVVIMPGASYCEIGADTHISHGTILAASGGIMIGGDCAISSGVIVYSVTNSEPQPGQNRTEAPPVSATVRIGDHVHIGANATILPGVTIGEWSVIGAGAVVTKDVPPRTTVAGVPARPLTPPQG